MKKTRWTTEEENVLRLNYEYVKNSELTFLLPNKTERQIYRKANHLNLFKKISKSKGDITWLENLDSPETCYWWGFITADGCFSDHTKSIIISLAWKDKDHLQLYTDKTKSKISKIFNKGCYKDGGDWFARTSTLDKLVFNRLKQRFNIVPKKTYNPFDITEFMGVDKLKYFLAGLIDGDGHINKQSKSIQIKIHRNWEKQLIQISDNLLLNYSIRSITKTCDQSTYLILHKHETLKLKELIVGNCPIMSRKWDKVK
jgi:hypothetical protein